MIESLLAACPDEIENHFYRTASGAEIDLVLTLGPNTRWAIEIKRAAHRAPQRGFYQGCEDIKATHRLLMHGGRDTFVNAQGLEAMTLADAVKTLRSEFFSSGR